jgi:hypothetical protein
VGRVAAIVTLIPQVRIAWQLTENALSTLTHSGPSEV